MHIRNGENLWVSFHVSHHQPILIVAANGMELFLHFPDLGLDLIDAEDKFIRIRPKLPNTEMQVGGAGFRHFCACLLLLLQSTI